VFAWLKQHLARKAFQKRFERHYGAAEGSHIQRSVIAAAMSEIEYAMVQTLRTKLSPEDQIAFMITYECMVMWSLGKGMETVLNQQDLESAIVAIQRHFATHAWYDDAFHAIWQKMQTLMPMAMRPGDNGCPPFSRRENSNRCPAGWLFRTKSRWFQNCPLAFMLRPLSSGSLSLPGLQPRSTSSSTSHACSARSSRASSLGVQLATRGRGRPACRCQGWHRPRPQANRSMCGRVTLRSTREELAEHFGIPVAETPPRYNIAPT
jgi:hypothetical protein